MKVLFFDPQRDKSFRPSTAPLGLLSIATYLNANGHKAVISDRSHEKESIKQLIIKNNPDVIGVSVTTYSAIKDALKIGKCAKKMGVPVIFGGATASILSKEFLESGSVDCISKGEGEGTWLEIAETFDKKESFEKIKGLAYIREGEYFETQKRDFIDLTTLPKLDWTLINPADFLQKGFAGKNQASIYFSKGCIRNCSFCYNNQMNNCQRRHRSLDAVVEEMLLLINEYGIDSFNFTDDLMFFNENQAIEIAEKFIESGIGEKAGWIGETCIGFVENQEIFDLLYKAGCRNLIFGVETCSPNMQKVINKKISLEKVEKTVSMCKRANIVPLLTFMIGLPGETFEDVKMTIDTAKNLDGAFCCFQIFTPMPGTKIYDDVVSEGKLKPLKKIEEYNRVPFSEKLVANISEFTTREIHTIYRYFKLKEFTYKDENAIEEQMFKVVLNVIKSMTGKGFMYFVKAGIKNAVSLFSLLSFFLHPKIRKKYGLYFKCQI